MNRVYIVEISDLTEDEFKFVDKRLITNYGDSVAIEVDEKGEPVDCWLAY